MVLDTSFRQGAGNPHPGALRDLGGTSLRGRTRRFRLRMGKRRGLFLRWVHGAGLEPRGPFRWGSAMEFSFTLALCQVADPWRARLSRNVAGSSDVHTRHEPQRLDLANQLSSFPGRRRPGVEAAGLVNEFAMGVVFIVAGARTVSPCVYSKVIPRANRTLVLGRAGPRIRPRSEDGDYDEIMPLTPRGMK